MREREDAARAFAAAMGWTYLGERDYPHGIKGPAEFRKADERHWHISLPGPAEPLMFHLSFVGRVADELGMGVAVENRDTPSPEPCWVAFGPHDRGCDHATDFSWAAMRAAITAKAATP